jgi:alpha-1,6-mannosyltransferase
LLTLTAFGLLLDVPETIGDLRIVRVGMLVGMLTLSAAAYFAAVRLILRYAWPRCTIWVVFGVAIALRALLLTAPPILSTDIYRYVWDGRVQTAGINPYRYIPADPALASLRDPIVYPQINRADYARTIYQPVAELVSQRSARSQTALRPCAWPCSASRPSASSACSDFCPWPGCRVNGS